MRASYTLSIYFARQYLGAFGLVIASLAAVILLFDVAELMRRGAEREGVGYLLILQMAALQLPVLLQKILPLAVLFGGMFTFLRLTRTHQLVVARGAGVSVWQFMSPALTLAVAIGSLSILVLDPFASAAVSRYEQLEGRYLRGQGSLLAVSKNGLWLRQASAVGQSVIHAERVARQGEELGGVTVFLYEGTDRFSGRIDAESAVLRPGYWDMTNALITAPEQPPRRAESHRLDTNLTLAQIQDSFAPPETLSFWELPRFIATLQEAGFSALNHRIHWHSLLSLPLLLFAMVLIAAAFSLRLNGQGNTGILLVGGFLAGSLVYVISDVAKALGLSGNIPVVLAAWSPAVVCVLLGLAALFHLEDG